MSAGAVNGLVDVHSHHYPDAYLDACLAEGSGFTHYIRDDGRLIVLQDGAVALAAPQPLPPLEHRLKMMDDAGVDIQVLSVSAPNVFRLPAEVRIPLTSELNDEFSRLCAQAGGRLRSWMSLPLPDVDASLAEIDRALALPYSVGIALCTTIDRRTLDDESFEPVWAELSRRKATVFCHPTVACCTDGLRDYALALALDFMAETTNAIGRLVYSGLLERHPGIKWIFTHLGGGAPMLVPRYDNYYRQFPECREKISRPPSEFIASLYFDSCTMHPPALRCAVDSFGASRLLFGSDYPHVPGGIDRFVDVMNSIGLTDDELVQIGRTNAEALIQPNSIAAGEVS